MSTQHLKDPFAPITNVTTPNPAQTKKRLEEIATGIEHEKEQEKRHMELYQEHHKKSRQHLANTRRLQNDRSAMIREYYDNLGEHLLRDLDITDFPRDRLIELAKAHLVSAMQREASIANRPDVYDHIVYAIFRGKPWHTGLCPNTWILGEQCRTMEGLVFHCNQRLSRLVARDIINKNAHLLIDTSPYHYQQRELARRIANGYLKAFPQAPIDKEGLAGAQRYLERRR